MSNYAEHPWEKIFVSEGRVFTDLLPAFHQAVDRFSTAGIRKVLDLGCGNGRHCVGFAQANFQVTGMDISLMGLDLTRSWLGEANLQADLLCGDAREDFPILSNSFEGLFSTQVIHHALLAEIRQTIREIWRVIVPGGLAFVTVAGRTHSNLSYEEIEPGTFLPLEGSEKGLPHHIFSEERLAKAFDRFEVLDLGPRDGGKVLAIWVRKPGD